MVIRIKQLPADIANQIAAGEVIERPASVVKELLENALDAQATSIHIEIEFGGLNRIKISDNGVGICAEDLPLAVSAHATSKINQLNDLYAIHTMGFRGEALASIASISQLSITSRTAQVTDATELLLRDGQPSLQPAARAPGTTVDVQELFYNAPVRKKFLKSEQYEFQAIEQIVKRFSLSNPKIAVKLTHNAKTIFELPHALTDKSFEQRIKKVLGKTFAEQSIYLNIEQGDMHLYGWISNESYQRSQNDKLWLYLNQRMLKDKLIHHAIKQAYENYLHPGRYPACLLYLTLPTDEVDVNVHPTKHEVRFQQPRLVHGFITSQIRKALSLHHPQPSPKTESSQTQSWKAPLCIEEKQTTLHAPTLPSTSSLNTKWFMIDKQYGILKNQKDVFLVDVEALNQQYIAAQLQQVKLPLASRPLLVPIRYHFDTSCQSNLALLQEHLAELGIEVAIIGEGQITIRTIPTLLPQLDLQGLLAHICKENINNDFNLTCLCIQYQTFNAEQLSETEILILTDYFQHLLTIDEFDKPIYTQLDAGICQKLLI